VDYILDTNILSDVLRSGRDTPQGQRIYDLPREQVRLTIITYEEMLVGRLMELAKDPKKSNLEPLHVRYSLLQETFRELQRYYPPLPFDVNAQSVYDAIPQNIKNRARVLDCRIAAIQVALGKGYTIISRDQKDFRVIEKCLDVQWDDWSVRPLPT
jgi:predicted nucleic acid-binding protein